jgi:hypothetical protein
MGSRLSVGCCSATRRFAREPVTGLTERAATGLTSLAYPAQVSEPEAMTLADLVDLARRKAVELADPALKMIRDEPSWTALATAVDELVEVVLFQQQLIEELLGIPGTPDLRFSRLVAQARAARNGSGAPEPAVPRQATPSH